MSLDYLQKILVAALWYNLINHFSIVTFLCMIKRLIHEILNISLIFVLHQHAVVPASLHPCQKLIFIMFANFICAKYVILI